MLCFFHRFVCRVQSKSRPVKAAGCGGRCWEETSKIARRCGEKHIWKSKCTKHDGFGALLSVQMSKNCTPLWAKSTFESQNVTKHRMFGPLLSVQMSKNCTPLWRKAHLKVKMLKNCSLRSTFWRSTVEKLLGAVAKRTFESQNVKKL